MIRLRAPFVATAASLLAVSACAHANARPSLPPDGSRVRISVTDSLRWAPYAPRSRSFIGTLQRGTSDTLWLHVAGPDTVRVPRSTVRRMEVSRGASRTSSALEQGLFVAVIFGSLAYRAADDSHEKRQAIAIVGSTAVLAAIIGAVRPYERWRRVR